MTEPGHRAHHAALGFPAETADLERFGFKFAGGGAHISRTIMLTELEALLESVPIGSTADEYREAILQQNVLGKATGSTRDKSLRHLRELYALDEQTPIFGLLRRLHSLDPQSLPQLAIQIAWARDPLLRATASTILNTSEGDRVDADSLSVAIDATFGDQYSPLNQHKIARNAASSWTQSGHLIGRAKKTRQRIKPTPIAVTMALFLGLTADYHGPAVFSSPWCQLLDLSADRARACAQDANRSGLLDLRAVGDVIELRFPRLAEFQVTTL